MATKATWDCSKCTYTNQSSSKLCEICGTIRINGASKEEWKCSKCSFVNSLSVDTCSICDTPQNIINNDDKNEDQQALIQNNYIPQPIYCKSIENCQAITRIIKVLHFYDTIQEMNNNETDSNKLLLDYFEKYKDLINDYHHILMVHLNTKTRYGNNTNFEVIHNKASKFIQCDITQCPQYRYNNRNRGRPKEQIKDKKSLYYMEWLNSIHCYLIHSYDVGFRMRASEFYHNKANIDEQKQNDDADKLYHDNEMERVKLHLSNKRKKLEEIRGIDRMINNKFSTTLTSSTEQKTDPKNNDEVKINPTDDDEMDEEVNLVEYFFGNRFLYWEWYKDKVDFNKWFITKKYENLKQEIMNNKIYNIEHDQYIEAYQKAEAVLNHSFIIKSMKSLGIYWYKIEDNRPLDVEHVLSIIFYTDYDILSYNFTKTYRKTTMSETDQSLKQRNSEYWNWGKLISETVECYGTPLHSSNISTFYHGTSMLYFTSFVTKFCCPTSTTPQIQVAAIFAKTDGIILELEKYPAGQDLRYFNCSIFSCYGNEDERLFAGGYKELQLKSIRTIADDKNYQWFIQSLRLFDKFIAGKTLVPTEKQSIKSRDYKIIDQLVDEILNDEYKSKHPLYIKKCFKKFCDKTNRILIDMKELSLSYNGFRKSFGESNHDNLVSIDKIALLFRNCTDIYLSKIGKIDEKYGQCMQIMLKELNQLKCMKLRKIVLCDVKKTQAMMNWFYVGKYGVDGWKTSKDNQKFLSLSKAVEFNSYPDTNYKSLYYERE